MKKIKSLVKSAVQKVKDVFAVQEAALNVKAHSVLDGTKAEAYVDTGVKVLIAVVLGALILTLLYSLFNDVMAPAVEERVDAMFSYAG